METVTFPVTDSDADGLKAIVSVAVCPAANASGVAIPLAEKSCALTETCETVMLAFPLFVMVTFWEFVLPTLIAVKLRLVGLAVIETVAATPVPLNDTVVGELGALLAILRLPLRLPAVVGANKTLSVAVSPAGRVAGRVSPLIV